MLRISMEGHSDVTLCYRNANVLTLILRNFHKSTVYNVNMHMCISRILISRILVWHILNLYQAVYIKFICSRLQIIQAKWKGDKEGRYITSFLHRDTTLSFNMFTCIKK